MGVLNEKGKEILPFIYYEISEHYNGSDYFKVRLKKEDTKPYYIYKSGEKIFSDKYNVIWFYVPK